MKLRGADSVARFVIDIFYSGSIRTTDGKLKELAEDNETVMPKQGFFDAYEFFWLDKKKNRDSLDAGVFFKKVRKIMKGCKYFRRGGVRSITLPSLNDGRLELQERFGLDLSEEDKDEANESKD